MVTFAWKDGKGVMRLKTGSCSKCLRSWCYLAWRNDNSKCLRFLKDGHLEDELVQV